jgi:hypothetical protein
LFLWPQALKGVYDTTVPAAAMAAAFLPRPVNASRGRQGKL